MKGSQKLGIPDFFERVITVVAPNQPNQKFIVDLVNETKSLGVHEYIDKLRLEEGPVDPNIARTSKYLEVRLEGAKNMFCMLSQLIDETSTEFLQRPKQIGKSFVMELPTKFGTKFERILKQHDCVLREIKTIEQEFQNIAQSPWTSLKVELFGHRLARIEKESFQVLGNLIEVISVWQVALDEVRKNGNCKTDVSFSIFKVQNENPSQDVNLSNQQVKRITHVTQQLNAEKLHSARFYYRSGRQNGYVYLGDVFQGQRIRPIKNSLPWRKFESIQLKNTSSAMGDLATGPSQKRKFREETPTAVSNQAAQNGIQPTVASTSTVASNQVGFRPYVAQAAQNGIQPTVASTSRAASNQVGFRPYVAQAAQNRSEPISSVSVPVGSNPTAPGNQTASYFSGPILASAFTLVGIAATVYFRARLNSLTEEFTRRPESEIQTATGNDQVGQDSAGPKDPPASSEE